MANVMPQFVGNASRNLKARRKKAAWDTVRPMDDRQRPVANWMRDVIARRGVSARAWAEQAGLGKDTVSRAMRDDYESVTTTRTLAKLAEAIGERPPGAAAAIPSAASLEAVLAVFVSAYSGGRAIGPDSLREFASSLRDTLLHLADEPHAAADPRLSQTLARALVRRAAPSASQH